jgi:hypothetical protein
LQSHLLGLPSRFPGLGLGRFLSQSPLERLRLGSSRFGLRLLVGEALHFKLMLPGNTALFPLDSLFLAAFLGLSFLDLAAFVRSPLQSSFLALLVAIKLTLAGVRRSLSLFGFNIDSSSHSLSLQTSLPP